MGADGELSFWFLVTSETPDNNQHDAKKHSDMDTCNTCNNVIKL